MEQRAGYEIDLIGVLRYLIKRIRIVIGATVICGVLAFTVCQFFLPRQYVASTRVFILSRSQAENVTAADFVMSDYMVSDCKVLVTGQNVTDIVIGKLDLQMTHEALSRKIRVSAESNTRVLQISVTDRDPQVASDIANCVREVAAEQIKSIMGVDAVNLVYEAKVPQTPSSPNVLKNTILFAALGFISSVCVLAMAFFLHESNKGGRVHPEVKV